MASATTVHNLSTKHGLDTYGSIPDCQDPVATPTTGSFTEAHTSTTTSTPFALLLGHPQVWEHPVSFIDKRINSDTFMIQNFGLDLDVTQSQLAQSPFHLPQIDWGSSQKPPPSYNNQGTILAGFSARPPTEDSRKGGSTPTERAPELDISHDVPFNVLSRTIGPPATSRAVPSQSLLPRGTPVPEERGYDRPGKKPAAPFQPDPLKLEQGAEDYSQADSSGA